MRGAHRCTQLPAVSSQQPYHWCYITDAAGHIARVMHKHVASAKGKHAARQDPLTVSLTRERLLLLALRSAYGASSCLPRAGQSA